MSSQTIYFRCAKHDNKRVIISKLFGEFEELPELINQPDFTDILMQLPREQEMHDHECSVSKYQYLKKAYQKL